MGRGEVRGYNQSMSAFTRKSQYRKTILKDFKVNLLAGKWQKDQAQLVLESLALLRDGLDRITGGRGREWIRSNLGGVSLSIGSDKTIWGNRLIMDRFFAGRSHVTGNRVYMAGDFHRNPWRVPGKAGDLWIIHELGHVWDDRSANGLGTLLGGGHGDALMRHVGARSKAFLGLRFVDQSLVIDPINAFGNQGYFAYGNNSPADYFAHAFAVTIAFPGNPNIPPGVESWMIDLINRTI